MKIYTISGLGADQRVFNRLDLPYPIVPIEWIPIQAGDTIQHYAKRLVNQVNTKEKFVLLGVSFGGVIATEMSKIIHPELTVLVSSVATHDELPLVYRLLGKTKIVCFLPTRLFILPKKWAAFLFGTKEKEVLGNILRDTDPRFVKWAIHELLCWTNKEKADPLYRIHGTNDRLIPGRHKGQVDIIEGGGHFMIYDRAKEISQLIVTKLKTALS